MPLLIDAPEILSSRTVLTLPAGKHLRNPPPPIKLTTLFGNYSFSAAEETPGKVAIEESLSMPEQRVQPSQYRAFAAFARAVDEAQSGELQVE